MTDYLSPKQMVTAVVTPKISDESFLNMDDAYLARHQKIYEMSFEKLKTLSLKEFRPAPSVRESDAIVFKYQEVFEKIQRRSRDGIYSEIIDRSRRESFGILVKSARLTSLTIGLSGAFFTLLIVSILIGVIGFVKNSTGIAESSLYVLAITLIIGIISSDRIVCETSKARG